jgi:polyketide cyclase/dehydrase/lipid transport protein
MATNRRFMPVPPEAVWDVLAEAGSYGYWVVGSKVIRDVEPEWPEAGAKFHHTIGAGPLTISDHTVALETARPRLFVLRAKGRPAGTATVTLRMTPRPEAGGTDVEMTENPDGVFSVLAYEPMTQLFTIARNAESLMRLEELAMIKAAEKVAA